MAGRLNTLPPELLSRFQLTHSRIRGLDPTKQQIYVLQDLAGDPEVQHLKHGGWKKFDKLIFVSHWQQQMYNAYLGIPFDAGVVMQNTIMPIPQHTKPTDKIRLMYYSTPHRGLELLYHVYNELYNEFGDMLELNVFSSFDLYGWDERDKPFESLFEKLKAHPGINYSKSVSNDRIREELNRSHILAYPSIWQETSCLVLIEALCAGLVCVHSSLAALPETSLGCSYMYPYTEDVSRHMNRFKNTLREAILDVDEGLDVSPERIQFLNDFYSWPNKKQQWEDLLTSLLRNV